MKNNVFREENNPLTNIKLHQTTLSKTNTISKPKKDNSPELSGGEQVVTPLLQVGQLDVEAGRNDTTFVESPCQVHHDLASPMVIDDLKLTDVTCQGNWR